MVLAEVAAVVAEKAVRFSKTRSGWLERSTVAGFLVLAPSVVLWLRQTPEALLRVDSFAGAIEQTVFWAVPTLLVCLLVLRTRVGLAIGGTAAAILSVGVWWSAATDWHSTASLSPGLTGWILLPIVLGLVGLISNAWARRRFDEKMAKM